MSTRRAARVNVRVLSIVIGVVAFLVIGGGGAFYWRKHAVTVNALAAANAAQQRGDWAATVKFGRRYLSMRPEDAEVCASVGAAYLRLTPITAEAISNARQFLRRAANQRPDDAALTAQLALVYKSTGESGELAALARRRLERAPGSPDATIWLGQSLLAQRKCDEARALLKPFVEAHENQAPKSRAVLDALLALHAASLDEKPDDALAWLDRAIAYDFETTEALLARAKLLRGGAITGMDAEAAHTRSVDDLRRAIEQGSEDPRVLLTLAQECLDGGDAAHCEAALRKVEAFDTERLRETFLDPEDASVAIFLVRAKQNALAGDVSECTALADAALNRFQSTAHRLAVLPVIVDLYNLANAAKPARAAMDEYRRMRGADAAKDVRVSLLEASVLRTEGRPFEARSTLEPLVRQNSANAVALRLLGLTYRDCDEPRRAAVMLSRYAELVPEDRAMGHELLALLRELGRWDAARELAVKLERLAPGDSSLALARIEALLGSAADAQPAEARELAAQAQRELETLSLPPEKSEIVALLAARAAALNGDSSAAETRLTELLARSPTLLEASCELARMKAVGGDVDEAIQLLRDAVARMPEAAAPRQRLAELLHLAGRAAESRAVLVEALDAVRDEAARTEINYILATLDTRAGDNAAAAARLGAMADKDRVALLPRLMLFQIAVVGGDVAEARKRLDEIRAIDGETGLKWRYCEAALAMSVDNWSERAGDVETWLNYCLNADESWAAPALLLATLRERQGRLTDAEASYRRALAIDPASTGAAQRLSGLLTRQKRFDEAREVLDRLPAQDAGSRAARLDVALADNDFPRAIEELKLLSAGDPHDVQTRLALAQLVYRQSHDVPRAEQYLDEAQSADPSSVDVAVARAALLSAENRSDEARAAMDACVGRLKSFDAYLARARFLAQQRDFDAAERDFATLRAMSPNGAGDAMFGQFLLDTGRLDEAIAAWSESTAEHPTNDDLSRRLMRGLFRRNSDADRRRAVELHRSLLAKLPKDPELLRIEGLLRIETGEPTAVREGERSLEAALALDSSQREAHLALIGLAVGRRDFDLARRRALRAVGALPDDPTLILAQADVERSAGEVRRARESVRAALARDPGRPEAVATLVDLALQTREKAWLSEAREAVDAAVRQHPNDETLVIASARLHDAQGQPADGLAQLESFSAAAGDHKPSVALLLALSEMLRVNGRIDESRARLQEAVHAAPDNPSVLRFRVFWHAERSEFDAIYDAITAQRQRGLSDPEILLTAGAALAGSPDAKHRALALELCESAAGLAPSWALAHLRLGLLRYQAGQFDAAESSYRRVLELDPLNAEALNNLAWILSEHRSQYAEAERLARKAANVSVNNAEYEDTLATILAKLGRVADALEVYDRCITMNSADPPALARALLRWSRTALSQPQPPVAEIRTRLDRVATIENEKHVLSEAEQGELRSLRERVAATP